MQAERSHKAANCVMSLLMLRDATKAPELFEKSMKVYLNLAERACAEPVEAIHKTKKTSTKITESLFMGAPLRGHHP